MIMAVTAAPMMVPATPKLEVTTEAVAEAIPAAPTAAGVIKGADVSWSLMVFESISHPTTFQSRTREKSVSGHNGFQGKPATSSLDARGAGAL
jgi:hypothetical protein